ncbi:unnamed protein product [Trichogramma brassicae]|uniref:Uncharacterized protein n=1 Tax=Trichogramma brassicae TaxID=86971 RepID=A0A6H5IKC2_9HYME|nr:unnamed protein product [Trichogramma brassicae]
MQKRTATLPTIACVHFLRARIYYIRLRDFFIATQPCFERRANNPRDVDAPRQWAVAPSARHRARETRVKSAAAAELLLLSAASRTRQCFAAQCVLVIASYSHPCRKACAAATGQLQTRCSNSRSCVEKKK